MEPNHVLCSANEMVDSLAKKEYQIRFPFVISCCSWFDAIFVFVVFFYFCLVCSLFLFALGTVLLYSALLCLAFSSRAVCDPWYHLPIKKRTLKLHLKGGKGTRLFAHWGCEGIYFIPNLIFRIVKENRVLSQEEKLLDNNFTTIHVTWSRLNANRHLTSHNKRIKG